MTTPGSALHGALPEPARAAPIGIYIHLPFCRVRCTYCAFAVSTHLSSRSDYVEALIREIERAPAARGETVFIGGGTPSLTAPADLARILGIVRERFQITPDAEVSIEANPEDIDQSSLSSWAAAGVNRLSIGVQSLHDDELGPLGRLHGRRGALAALDLAARQSFTLSADLIIGLPGQTAESFSRSLRGVLDTGVDHLSLYMLDLEEKTALETQVLAGRVSLPPEEVVETAYLEAVATCRTFGLAQYEVSNFARAGFQCRHNVRYWTRDPYRGFGLGAHSFDGRRRFANTRSLEEYLRLTSEDRATIGFEETLSPAEQREERLLLALRRTEGILYAELQELCGREGVLWTDRGLDEGWLELRNDRINLTPRGFLLSNELISQLF